MDKNIIINDTNYEIPFFDLSNITSNSRILIFGKPGVGKKTLIKNIIKNNHNNDQNHGCLIVSVSNNNTQKYLNYLDNISVINTYDSNEIILSKYIIIDNPREDSNKINQIINNFNDKLYIIVRDQPTKIHNLDYIFFFQDNIYINHVKIHDNYFKNLCNLDNFSDIFINITTGHNILVLDNNKMKLYWYNSNIQKIQAISQDNTIQVLSDRTIIYPDYL